MPSKGGIGFVEVGPKLVKTSKMRQRKGAKCQVTLKQPQVIQVMQSVPKGKVWPKRPINSRRLRLSQTDSPKV